MPSPSRIVLVAASLLATSSAQTDDKATVWGSVVVVNNGERTPLFGFPSPILTPQGAIQMRFQGDAFRKRYLSGPGPQSENITDNRPIKDISQDAINNAQLSITSLTDDYIVGGATAFMQGLYPPNPNALLDSYGGQDLSVNTVLDENVSYPLSGYQYPAIETVAVFDERSTVLQGQVGCHKWHTSAYNILEDPVMRAFADNSSATYKSLFSRPALAGTIPESNLDFYHAYELWEYVRYQQIHNTTVYVGLELMTDLPSIMNTLENNARIWQQALYADGSISGVTAKDTVRTIGGQTLADGILDRLTDIITTGGVPGDLKLVTMFTAFPALLSFFSLAGLRTSETDVNDDFFGIPEPGAAMAFELVGDQPGAFGQFPDENNLWVRFVYRKDTDASTSFRAVPLFRRPNSQYVMPWVSFRTRMKEFTTGVTGWCNMCDASGMPYCQSRTGSGGSGAAVDGSSSGGGGSGVRNPVIAGVIGAVVTLAVAGLIAAAAALFGGVRLYRRTKGEGDSKRGLGGFKGAEKMASDVDVTLGRGGVRHERMGSWELRSGDVPGGAVTGAAPATATRPADDDVEPGRLGAAGLSFQQTLATPRARPAVDDDGVSALSADIGTAPVRPRESI
ncbi:histidine phosphatase superfamily [Plectosphaerella cucumerina]|uniref:Histidine phosphatase superfamily n=1 Tax=Plectosphaerella cucumerina TaxID=40658 RepID=A0A8K0WZF8_9PEZI|nr:histidine phosphatase superfamily [Plectosphaerella cucumerina]